MSNQITLQADPRGNYVTWANGKKQVRAALKANGYKAVVSSALARSIRMSSTSSACERTKHTHAQCHASLTQLSLSHT